MSKRENINKRRQTQQETSDNIEKIEGYLSSSVRQNLLRGITLFHSQKKIGKQDYYNYRAVLIGEVIFRSAQRSGVVIGMKKTEVANAQKQDTHAKIIVFDHKTGKLRPAIVFLESLAAAAFENFLKVILPQINDTENNNSPFFISYNGKQINHAGIQSSLNKLIHLTGISKTITSTKSRIAAATFIATSKPEKTQVVADYMQHQASTADKYYRQMGGGSHLINAFDALGEIRNK